MNTENELLNCQLMKTIENVEQLKEFSKVILLFLNQDEDIELTFDLYN